MSIKFFKIRKETWTITLFEQVWIFVIKEIWMLYDFCLVIEKYYKKNQKSFCKNIMIYINNKKSTKSF